MVITIYSIPNCIYCDQAIDLAHKYKFEVAIRSARDLTEREWLSKIGKIPKTAPQIFIGSEYIGGYTDLKRYLELRVK
jgi:glutaredoxin 1